MGDALAPYRADSLLLLLGENPLPNYVAARLLAKPGARVGLLLAAGLPAAASGGLRDLLAERAGDAGLAIELVEMDRDGAGQSGESNPALIDARVRAWVRGLRARPGEVIGLHYTGGTKAMAVHAYRALEQACRQGDRERAGVVYSYLDPRGRRLWFTGTDSDGHRIAAHVRLTGELIAAALPEFTLRELIRLHSREPAEQETGPRWPSAATALAAAVAQPGGAVDWLGRCRERLRDPTGRGQLRKDDALAQVPIGDFGTGDFLQVFCEEAGCGPEATLRDIGRRPGLTATAVAGWLEGRWLRDYTLLQMTAACRDCGVPPPAMGLTVRIGGDFTLDVACVSGYQLFAIACAATADPDTCQGRLFGVLNRARQLGGAEARAALVCCSDRPLAIKDEVEGLYRQQAQGASYADQVLVLGRRDLATLREQLAAWLRAQG